LDASNNSIFLIVNQEFSNLTIACRACNR